MQTSEYTLTGVGVTPWVQVTMNQLPQLPPAVLANVSGTMTYSVEVTGNPNTGLVNTFDGMSGLTTSANGTLGASVPYIRAHVTAYTSGTLTFQVINPS